MSTESSRGIRPDYYGGESDPFEPVKVIRAWDLNFNLGNVLKYVRRARQRNGLDDLRKARTYLDIEIAALEADLPSVEEVQGILRP